MNGGSARMTVRRRHGVGCGCIGRCVGGGVADGCDSGCIGGYAGSGRDAGIGFDDGGGYFFIGGEGFGCGYGNLHGDGWGDGFVPGIFSGGEER